MAWKGMAAFALLAAGAAVGAVLATQQAPAARQEAVPGGAIAEAPVDDAALVAARQETMQRMEAVWLMLSDMIGREEGRGSVAEGAAAAAAAAEGAGILAGLFDEMQRQYPEGTFAPPSLALPEVRADWAAFSSLARDAEQRAEALASALAAGRVEEAKDLLSAVERDCSACHLRFSPGIRSDLRPLPPDRP